MKSSKLPVKKNIAANKARVEKSIPAELKKKKENKEGKRQTRKPTILQMLIAALQALKKRQGISRAAIVKYLSEAYHVKPSALFNSILRKTLKANVEKGILLRKGNMFKLVSSKESSASVPSKKIRQTSPSRHLSLKQVANGLTPPLQVKNSTTSYPGMKNLSAKVLTQKIPNISRTKQQTNSVPFPNKEKRSSARSKSTMKNISKQSTTLKPVIDKRVTRKESTIATQVNELKTNRRTRIRT